ncbi:hypothetical protein NMY22_g6950 [Coprinellus aureogranulatus]|nr:hypothetical protein NMY22_g6950 [Coprinellus aureogranulatus]
MIVWQSHSARGTTKVQCCRSCVAYKPGCLPQKSPLTASSSRYAAWLIAPPLQPTTFIAVDAMHNLFLSLSKTHCNQVWGMDVKPVDGDSSYQCLSQIPSVSAGTESARLTLAVIDDAFIRKLAKGVLYRLCEEAGLRRRGRKAGLLRELKHLRNSKLCALDTPSTSMLTKAAPSV